MEQKKTINHLQHTLLVTSGQRVGKEKESATDFRCYLMAAQASDAILAFWPVEANGLLNHHILSDRQKGASSDPEVSDE